LTWDVIKLSQVLVNSPYYCSGVYARQINLEIDIKLKVLSDGISKRHLRVFVYASAYYMVPR